MKDEIIKEILDFKEDADYKRLSVDEIVILEDYITNLQEKYEEADNDRHKLFEQKEKAIEYIELWHYRNDFRANSFTISVKDELLNILQGSDK